ncbi:unnamed protein product [Sphacelaria rigidula]
MASKALKPATWFQSVPRPDPSAEEQEIYALSDISALDDTTHGGQCRTAEPTENRLWRLVRMIVHGVRGEARGLMGTVQYRSARRLQCFFRQALARRGVVRRLADACAARQAGEALRLRRRQRELNALNRYKSICREEGRRVIEWSVKYFLRPWAVVDIQKIWRGHR